MKDEQVERMFEPFSTDKAEAPARLDYSSPDISDHGGRIDVSSAVGKGTKILIMLPHFYRK